MAIKKDTGLISKQLPLKSACPWQTAILSITVESVKCDNLLRIVWMNQRQPQGFITHLPLLIQLDF